MVSGENRRQLVNTLGNHSLAHSTLSYVSLSTYFTWAGLGDQAEESHLLPRYSYKGERRKSNKEDRGTGLPGKGCSETLGLRKGPQVPKQESTKGQVQSHSEP